jgi:two-component system, cell cycle sensor histidine kinase and response regulator CckA
LPRPDVPSTLSPAAEQALLAAVGLCPLPFCVVDLTDPNQGRVQWLSESCPSKLEAEQASWLLRSLSERLGHEGAPRDPRWALANIPGEPGRWVALLDEACFESEVARGFESLAESLPNPVWIVRAGIIRYANPAAVAVLGVDRWEVEEHSFAGFCHRRDASAIHACFEEVAETLRPRAMRTRIPAHDMKERSLELRVVPLVGERQASVLVFGQDLADAGCSEEVLLQADRSAALGLLAGGMAHALNNPLTYVLLNLDHIGLQLPRLEREPELASDLLARVAEAREGAERMAGVVRRMHLFSRAHETEPTLVSISSVLESVVELLGHEIRHRGALTTRVVEVPLVLARKSWVEQICLRLLLFAALNLPEDSAQRGAISLVLRPNDDDSARAEARLEVLCDNVSLRPSDVPDLTSNALAVNPTEGSPGSLAVCQRLLVQLGGALVVELAEGRGLSIRASFPAADLASLDSTPPSSHPPSSMPPRVARRARIMVIDDDVEVGEALRLLLAEDHQVQCFTEPRRALRVLLQDATFDLVFCDVMMPELGGPAVYQALRFNRPGYEFRLVFMTGGAFEPSVQRFLAKVPNPRIDKPFNLRVVQRLVEQAAARRGLGS